MGDSTRETLFLRHSTAATWAIMAESVYTYPLDTIKTLLQVGADASEIVGVSRVVEAVRSSSGLQGFYGGVGWVLLGRLPVLGVRFGVYELLAAFYRDGRNDRYIYVSEAFLAGFTAGAMEALAATPFDILKLRSQMTAATRAASLHSNQRTPAKVVGLASQLLPGISSDAGRWDRVSQILAQLPTKHANLVGALKDYPWLITGSGDPPLVRDVRGVHGIVSLEGWRALWRGFQPGLCRDAIFGSFFFSSWQFLCDALMDWKALNMDPPPRSLEDLAPLSPLQLSTTAGIAASIAATASHCFDTVKSRSQGAVMPKYVFMERQLLKWKSPGTWYQRAFSLNPLDWKFRWRALGIRAAQQGIGTFTLIGTYNMAILYLTNK
eukprot:c23871_g1_i1 orf=184-1323(+)